MAMVSFLDRIWNTVFMFSYTACVWNWCHFFLGHIWYVSREKWFPKCHPRLDSQVLSQLIKYCLLPTRRFHLSEKKPKERQYSHDKSYLQLWGGSPFRADKSCTGSCPGSILWFRSKAVQSLLFVTLIKWAGLPKTTLSDVTGTESNVNSMLHWEHNLEKHCWKQVQRMQRLNKRKDSSLLHKCALFSLLQILTKRTLQTSRGKK